MALSTLSETNAAVMAHFRQLFTENFPEYFTDTFRFAFCPSSDEETDFRRLRELRKDQVGEKGQLIFPSVCTSLMNVDDVWQHHYGPAKMVLPHSTNRKVTQIPATQVDLIYSIRTYVNTYEEFMLFMEIWALFIMNTHRITFRSSVLNGEELRLKLEFNVPRFLRVSSSGDQYSGKGHIYALETQMRTFGILALNMNATRETKSRIFKTVESYFYVGPDAVVTMQSPEDLTQYWDKVKSTIQSTDRVT